MGHLIGPAEDAHSVTVFSQLPRQPSPQIFISASSNGEFQVIQSQQAMQHFAGLRLTRVDRIKDFWSRRHTAGVFFITGFSWLRKNRTDRKAGYANFLGV